MSAVFLNELRLLLRDRGAVVWLLLGPILFITVFSAARYQSSKRPPLLVPVVDDDQGPVARTFVKLLREHADVLETSRAEAEAMVRDRGRAAAAVVTRNAKFLEAQMLHHFHLIKAHATE